jgi:EPS-associated MarR family transcriptional regulator
MTSRQAKIQEDTHFRIMRILQDNPDLTQRELAEMLGMSVGGLNYCLNALIEKGFVKVGNFQKSKNKFKLRLPAHSPRYCRTNAMLTTRFLKRKMEEYEALRAEIDVLQSEANQAAPQHSGNLDFADRST